LAGELGVGLFSALLQAGAFTTEQDGLALTPAGHGKLFEMGLSAKPAKGRRRYAFACHDWSEGRDHLAGALGDQLLQHLLEHGWLRKGVHRELTLTPQGQLALKPLLGSEVSRVAE
jgi:hypothetical protein